MFKGINGVYNNIYSLGSNCQIAYQLKINYLRFVTGPFDWYATNNLAMITNNIKNRFQSFFLPENMLIIGGTNKDKYYIYKDKLTNYTCFHDIHTNQNQVEQLIELHQRFRRRTDKMFENIHKSKNNLFIRIICEENECLLDLDNALLQEFGENYKLMGIQVSKSSKISLFNLNSRTFLCKMNTNTRCLDMEEAWKGNINSWEQLLYQVYYNNSNLKQHYFKQRKQNLDKIRANIRKRNILVWGCGNELFIIQHILEREGFKISKLYDEDKLKVDRLPKNMVFKSLGLNVNKFYIIITQSDIKNGIRGILNENKYVEDKDYIFFFEKEKKCIKTIFD